MKNIKNRYIIVSFAIVIVICLVNYLDYDTYQKAEDGTKAINGIPLELGEWHGKDIPLEAFIYELLETKSIIHRKYYSDNGTEVFLSIVYHSETKVNFHAPEQCLGAQGIPVEKTLKSIMFKSNGEKVNMDLNRLVQEQYGQQSLFYYFFKAGEFVGPNYLKLRLNIAMNKFTNKKKSGALIRISTPISGDKVKKADKVLTDFIKRLYPYMISHL